MASNRYYIVFFIGYLLIIVGVLLHFFNVSSGVVIFAIGGVLNIVSRLLLLPRSSDKRIRRLNNQHMLVSIFLVLSGYLIITDHSAWVVPILLMSLIDLWLSYRYRTIE